MLVFTSRYGSVCHWLCVPCCLSALSMAPAAQAWCQGRVAAAEIQGSVTRSKIRRPCSLHRCVPLMAVVVAFAAQHGVAEVFQQGRPGTCSTNGIQPLYLEERCSFVCVEGGQLHGHHCQRWQRSGRHKASSLNF
uniref:Secreted protein n=1 Tax=Eutreptiella gymnastica TaxID=73025 RepID=A0A7S4CIT9_9EUGL|mmetsp:Transcript_102816/g.174217  ORF Transcript_102816/g.174217 Transcript_102816/m.174217 type:complete len:135 (+) Transcript_102816:692-1096(+)